MVVLTFGIKLANGTIVTGPNAIIGAQCKSQMQTLSFQQHSGLGPLADIFTIKKI